MTEFVIAAPNVAFSVRRVLCAPLRFDALFVVLRLRDTFARFEAVFLARDAVLAAVGPRALPPPTLARDLDAVVFADVPLRVAAVLTTVFLEAAVLFFLGFDVLLAGPRVLIPAPDLEAVVFDDLAIHTPLSWDWDLPAARRASAVEIKSAGKGTSSPRL